MRFVSRRKYDALQTRCQQVIEQRDLARHLADKRLAVVTRQAEKLTSLDDKRPATPVREPLPRPRGDVELRRQLRLAQEARASLDKQILTLQAANEAMAAELRAISEREVTAP